MTRRCQRLVATVSLAAFLLASTPSGLLALPELLGLSPAGCADCHPTTPRPRECHPPVAGHEGDCDCCPSEEAPPAPESPVCPFGTDHCTWWTVAKAPCCLTVLPELSAVALRVDTVVDLPFQVPSAPPPDFFQPPRA